MCIRVFMWAVRPDLLLEMLLEMLLERPLEVRIEMLSQI